MTTTTDKWINEPNLQPFIQGLGTYWSIRQSRGRTRPRHLTGNTAIIVDDGTPVFNTISSKALKCTNYGFLNKQLSTVEVLGRCRLHLTSASIMTWRGFLSGELVRLSRNIQNLHFFRVALWPWKTRPCQRAWKNGPFDWLENYF